MPLSQSTEGIELGKGQEGGEGDEDEWSEEVEWRSEVRLDRSKSPRRIEILITDDLCKIKPTDPLRWPHQTELGEENETDQSPPVILWTTH